MTIQKIVLIADDGKDLLSPLSEFCVAMNLRLVSAGDGLQALSLIARQNPDLVILDLEMDGADGLSVCKHMSRDEVTAATPVIILAGPSNADMIRSCEAVGAHCLVKDSETWSNVRSIICRVLDVESADYPRGPATKPLSSPTAMIHSAPTILVVDDEVQILRALKIRLSAYGANVVVARNGYEAYGVAAVEAPDVIVTDYTMPGGSGEYLLRRLKSDPETEDIPVIVLTGRTFDDKEDVALKRDLVGRGGAVAYLNKPVDENKFVSEIRKHVSLPGR